MTPEPRTLKEMSARYGAAQTCIEQTALRHQCRALQPAPPAAVPISLDEQVFQEQLDQYRAVVGDKPTPRRDIAEVAARHGLSVGGVPGLPRTTKIVVARHEAVAAVFDTFPSTSLPWIGLQFDRNHTTIPHVLRKMGRLSAPGGAA